VIWTFNYPLRTERLDLRPHTLADLDDLEVFHGDPDVTRYIPWPVRDREQVRAALVAKIPQISASAAGEWIVLAVEQRSSGRVIGEVLLKRESDSVAEIGYAFARQGQGKGLATEAVVSLMSAAQRQLGILTFDAVVEQPNVASARLLTRAGFTPAPSTEPGLLSFRRAVSALTDV
jgi:RimJ/RimL family protein N-acetyltransferase